MMNNIRKSRLIKGSVFFCAVFVFFISFLVKYQIADGEKYSYITDRTSVSKRKVTAARGIILDRNARALVSNRQGNTIIFLYDKFPSYKKQQERNDVISELIELFEKAGEEWENCLPITLDKNNNAQFKEKTDTEIRFMKSRDMLHLNDYAT
ncbi:MAG TPA: hypothetical protein PKN28_05570, partial [Clostridiales bacterium]|nr:hypothetical protein [Clostridiales bacterium]